MEIVMPVDQMFSDLRALSVDSAHAPLAYNGNPLKARFLHEKTETLPNMEAQESDHQDVPKDGIRVRIYDEDGRFIGIYCYHEKRKEYKLEKMFWDQEELRG